MPPERPSQLAYIQALRGLAAAAVVLYHARIFIDGGAYLSIGSRLFNGGQAGVDLFFVISGFIMVHTTADDDGSPRSALRFAGKRFARIWPVWAVAYGCMWLVTRASDSPAFATTWMATAKSLAFIPLKPHEAAPFFGYPLLHPGWTLNYEAFFYLLFAVSLLAPRRVRPVVLAALFAACLVGIPLLLKDRVQWDAMRSYGFRNYLCIVTSPIVWDFGFGVLIAMVHRSRFVIRDLGLVNSLCALAAGAVLWQLLSGYRAGHGPTHWGIPMGVLVLMLTLRNKLQPFAVPRALTWLGDISYSLYLFHVLPQMTPRMWKHGPPQLLGGGGFFVACLVSGVVLSYLAHRFLERGLSEWVRRKLVR